MNDENEQIRELRTILIRSYLFWSQTMLSASKTSYAKQCWDKKDYAGYMNFCDNTCEYCNNGKLIEPSEGDEPLVMKGIEIGTVYCLCASLKILASKSLQPWETAADNWHWAFEKPKSPFAQSNTIFPVAVPDAQAAEKTKNIIKAFDNFSKNPTRWGFLIGGTGVGKSSLLQALKSKMGGFAYYLAMAEFRSTVMDWKKVNLKEVEAHLISAPVLLIDDWGMGKDTSFATDMLAGVVEKRYLLKRLSPIIMTSNISREELIAVPGAKITNRERIISRFLDSEIASLLVSTQQDMRLSTAKNKAKIDEVVYD